ncbi:hypothetical protein G6F22_020564 [Rhizopus arrhizus]|nr:hypothetical protein G6F22_020564 [Rhizopus arrhizus]
MVFNMTLDVSPSAWRDTDTLLPDRSNTNPVPASKARNAWPGGRVPDTAGAFMPRTVSGADCAGMLKDNGASCAWAAGCGMASASSTDTASTVNPRVGKARRAAARVEGPEGIRFTGLAFLEGS